MLLNFEVVLRWEKNIKTSTIKQYRGKVNSYVNKNENTEIEEALNMENLAAFIFEEDGKAALGKYNALKNFYEYIYIKRYWKRKNMSFL